MDKNVKDLYIFVLKYGGRIINFCKAVGGGYRVVVEREPNMVDIDSSSEYVKTFRDSLYLRSRR